MTRPLGVTILAILALIGGIFGILGGLTVTFLGGVAAAVGGVGGLGGLIGIVGILVLVVAVVELALAYGFWTLKLWAWQAGWILEIAAVVLAVLELLTGFGITNVIVSVVVAGIVLYYLNTPDVRKAFGAPEKGFPIVGEVGGK